MIQALLFDVFGTVVDWRSGISKDFELISKKYGLKKIQNNLQMIGELNISLLWKR